MHANHNTKVKDHLLLAITFAMLNAGMLAGMSLFAKLLSQYYGAIEVTFFRNLVSLIVLFAWIFFAGKLFVLKTERPWAHVFRGAIGTVGIVFSMLAVSILSLSETTVLLFTSPLFAIILSAIFLKERIGIFRIGAVICGFIGVLIIAAPWNGFSIPILGLIAGLSWGFLSGSVDTCLRWMGTSEKSTTNVFYFALFGTIATAFHWPFAQIQPGAFSPHALWIILGLGATGLLGLLFKTQSFRLGEASIISPVMYTMIIWSMLFDYLFWNNMVKINVVIGAAIIISSNLLIFYLEQKKHRLKASPQSIRETIATTSS